MLLGTLYPLALDTLHVAHLSAGPPYFNAVFFPLMAPAFVFAGCAAAVPWRQARPSTRQAEASGTALRASPVPQADVPATAGQLSGVAPTAEPARTYPLEEQKK